MRLEFQSKTLAAFWIGLEKEYPLHAYPCQIGFSAVTSIKTKYRSKLDIENELRVAISKLQPRFYKICSMKQAHISH
ncbi:Uncharacterized protein FKW44_004247 [Caligus rogercresseyi]|uniref:Uncharacterized protein n=1 Tax=Caligus rogercresseyi TaxID=217165 RepID=A0A7T8HLE1_CALRO|nr:Uncharacterized protein FKW44_004247 [Caligus rogercresseyi]